jgi:hypothetical protein
MMGWMNAAADDNPGINHEHLVSRNQRRCQREKERDRDIGERLFSLPFPVPFPWFLAFSLPF